jgi:pyrroloquinoline quinone biosynthesis protein D
MTEATTLARGDVIELNPLYFLRWEDTQQAHILLYPEGVVKLNETAGQILKHCAGGKSVGDVIGELEQLYTEGDVAGSAMKFLEVCHAKGWIRRKS